MSERSLIYYTDFLACVKQNPKESRKSGKDLRLGCLVARYIEDSGNRLISVQELGYIRDDYAPVRPCFSWCVMESERRAAILDRLAKQYRISVLNPARWEDIELHHVLEGVESLATLMGGSRRFQSEMRSLKQTVHISRVTWRMSAAAMALPGVDVVYFKLASWSNPPELKWQTVHELAHTWDMRRLYSLSRGLWRATDSRYGKFRWQLPIPFEYKPGGRWLKDRNPPLNSLEDWADSVATYVYQEYADERKRMVCPIRWNYVRQHMGVKLPYPPDWVVLFYGPEESPEPPGDFPSQGES